MPTLSNCGGVCCPRATQASHRAWRMTVATLCRWAPPVTQLLIAHYGGTPHRILAGCINLMGLCPHDAHCDAGNL